MAAPDFIVPPPGLIPAAAPGDEPDRTVRDPRPRVLPVFPPPTATPQPTPQPRPADGAWRLRGPDGLEVLLVGPVVLGRDPAVDATHPAGAAIVLVDPARSVSKTHAAVDVVDGRVLVTDLHSTNGTRVLTAEGEVRELEPGRAADAPAGATLLLGEYAVRLDRAPQDTV